MTCILLDMIRKMLAQVCRLSDIKFASSLHILSFFSSPKPKPTFILDIKSTIKCNWNGRSNCFNYTFVNLILILTFAIILRMFLMLLFYKKMKLNLFFPILDFCLV